jgi:tight adherence protein B
MKRLLIAAVVGAVTLMPTYAMARSQSIRIEDANRSGKHISFEVYTPGGPLLTADDFDVMINGLPAGGVVATASPGVRRPAGAVLVLDSSGSMKGRPIAEAKRATALFVKTVERDARLALVQFSDGAGTLAPFTTDRQALLRHLRGIQASGETALYEAVQRASALVRGRPVEQRNIVLLSDGADTVSDTSLQNAVAAATTSGATVFIVGLRSPEYSVDTIRSLAKRTGGKTLVTRDATKLSGIFKGLAQTLISRYDVSVVNPDPSATLLDVEIEVTGEVEAFGRQEFRFPLPPTAADEVTLSRLPIPLLLLIVGLAVGIATFLVSEVLRRRTSPADRIVWYDDDGNEEVDKDALIDAAVLDRAKQLATRLADRAGYLERIDATIDAAGLRWRPGEVIVASALLSFAGLFLGVVLLNGMAGGALVGFAALVAPAAYIRIQAAKRRKAFEEQLPDVLQMISGALRAGYSIQQSLAAVAEDGQPPASEEFRRATAEIRLGATIDEALRQMARRIRVLDFDWVVMAIEIQREVGGDLGEVLETIAQTIRERARLRGHIRALTAEGRLSGWILGGLPFFMVGTLLVVNPDYLATLFEDALGIAMIAGASLFMIIGVFWMRKVIRIEV